ncbi:hypothetical protein Tco_1432394, partial [Tanacetum coccineum]
VIVGYRCALCRDYLVQLLSSFETDRARSSRVPVSLPDDPYMAVRQAYLATTDTESEPFEDPLEAEIPQSPHVVPSSILPPITHHTKDSEASEPSETRTTSSDSTAPLSPDHQLTHTSPTRAFNYQRIARMAVRTPPTASPGVLAFVAEVDALSPSLFLKRYRPSYETPSPSSSPALPSWKRYWGTSELIADTESESSKSDSERKGLEDGGPDTEEDEEGEAAPEG